MAGYELPEPSARARAASAGLPSASLPAGRSIVPVPRLPARTRMRRGNETRPRERRRPAGACRPPCMDLSHRRPAPSIRPVSAARHGGRSCSFHAALHVSDAAKTWKLKFAVAASPSLGSSQCAHDGAHPASVPGCMARHAKIGNRSVQD